jgi:hypothetical protein
MIPEPVSNFTVGGRVRMSRAGSALLVAEESRQSLGWFYLSFATGYEFRGAIIVWAHGILTAVQRAGELGIDPGGEVLCCPVPRRHLRRVPHEMRHRLLSEAELRGILDGKRIGE